MARGKVGNLTTYSEQLQPLDAVPEETKLQQAREIIENLSPKTTSFSYNERLLSVVAIAVIILVFIILEAFFYNTENIYSPLVRNTLFFLSIIVLVTVAYAVLNFKDVEKLTTVGYLFIFYAIFAVFAMIAGRIGYGLAITTALMLFFIVGMLYKETKEQLLIIALLIIAGWAMYITYYYITEIAV